MEYKRECQKMICGYRLSKIIRCCITHWLLGFCVGASVYWLTSTMLLRTTLGSHMDAFSISQCSLVVALCCAVASHIVEDFTLDRF